MKALSGAKLALSIFAAVGIGAAAFVSDAGVARAGDDPSNQFSVSARQSGGSVSIVITPSSDKYFVNMEYPLKITLAAKSGGSLSQEKLTKSDGNYAKSDHENKAKSVTFTVNADKGVTGSGKVVICSLDACGNPTEFKVDSN